MPTKPRPTPVEAEPRFIGATIEEFVTETAKQVAAGQYFDGMEMPPEHREALGSYVKAVQGSPRKLRYYFFVWSQGFLIKMSL